MADVSLVVHASQSLQAVRELQAAVQSNPHLRLLKTTQIGSNSESGPGQVDNLESVLDRLQEEIVKASNSFVYTSTFHFLTFPWAQRRLDLHNAELLAMVKALRNRIFYFSQEKAQDQDVVESLLELLGLRGLAIDATSAALQKSRFITAARESVSLSTGVVLEGGRVERIVFDQSSDDSQVFDVCANQNAQKNDQKVVIIPSFWSTKTGIAYCAARISEALSALGYRVVRHDIASDSPQNIRPDLIVAVGNGSHMEDFRRSVGPKIWDSSRVVGQWAWEARPVPSAELKGLLYVDEVWANSSFVQDLMRAAIPNEFPVRKISIPISLGPQNHRCHTTHPSACVFPKKAGRVRFGIVFDAWSLPERKRPLESIQAYTSAFDQDAGAQLLIKTQHLESNAELSATLLDVTAKRRDIVVVDAEFSRALYYDLVRTLDVFVSLHASEGLGIPLLEAMHVGVPVIATSYGGNLDFMSKENSYLVESSEVKLLRAVGPYPKESVWALPSLGHAAVEMRRAFADPVDRAKRGLQARLDARRLYSREILQNQLHKLLLKKLPEVKHV